MNLQVKLQVFEGPLDLLLHLIDKNKVDIYDIPIVTITDQYMEYINSLKEARLDVMSEFLVMAATLLSIKSKMLLPKAVVEEDGEETEDPRAELVAQLLEYKLYKSMSYELRDRQMDADRIFYKAPTIPEEVLKYEQPVNIDELVSDLTLQQLNDIFKQVMSRVENRVDPIRSKFGKIKKEEVSLEDKRLYMMECHTRTEVVVTFLCILEMMKSGQITIFQEHTFDDIAIESKIAA